MITICLSQHFTAWYLKMFQYKLIKLKKSWCVVRPVLTHPVIRNSSSATLTRKRLDVLCFLMNSFHFLWQNQNLFLFLFIIKIRISLQCTARGKLWRHLSLNRPQISVILVDIYFWKLHSESESKAGIAEL